MTNPEALDGAAGPRAQLSIVVPQKWLRQGADIEVIVPKRLHCCHCQGGGCDSCSRTGVLRAPAESSARTLRLQVPADHVDGVKLRLVNPMVGCVIEQLIVTIRGGSNPSQGVRKLASTKAIATASPQPLALINSNHRVMLLVAVVVAAVASFMAWW